MKIKDTLLISHICKKCSGYQRKVFLSFGIKEGTPRELALYVSSFILISLKIGTKMVEVIKKYGFFTIQETFVLSSICQKCQGTQIQAILCFELKGDEKGRGTAITKLLQIGLKWWFWPMVYKSNVSCLPCFGLDHEVVNLLSRRLFWTTFA